MFVSKIVLELVVFSIVVQASDSGDSAGLYWNSYEVIDESPSVLVTSSGSSVFSVRTAPVPGVSRSTSGPEVKGVAAGGARSKGETPAALSLPLGLGSSGC